MSFLLPWFALAGLLAAVGPVLIHLLNRRRFRVIQWAAMDFLREALAHSRRWLRLRDLLLLVLRVACLLAFGIAMARPFWGGGASGAAGQQPVHAVLLVDNSLSTSYQQMGGTVLDEIKQKSRRWIQQQPAGSRYSVVPLCGSRTGVPTVVYPTREEALEVLEAVSVVDRATTPAAALDLALEAVRRSSDVPDKRIALATDAHLANASPEDLQSQLARLPAPVEIVAVTPENPENAWISDFRLVDEVTDAETPAVFLAVVRYQGSSPRRDVQLRLTVEGTIVGSTTVELLPGQVREVRFPPYRIPVAPSPGRPVFIVAEVTLGSDRLPADDRRQLVVPVVASLPVVFIDQYGASEEPRRSRYGETFALRRLLAPASGGEAQQRSWIEIRQATAESLRREMLQDARLVVVAGVSDPEPCVALLREYVEQGGPLFVAAGGSFEPLAWNAANGRHGGGILPGTLRGLLVGRGPDEGGGPLAPTQLDPESLVHDWFLLPQVAREELQDLYRLPFFFKAAAIELNEKNATGSGLPAARPDGAKSSRWLLWQRPPRAEDLASSAESPSAAPPRVLARLSDGVPYLVEQRIGQGRVVWTASGFSASWSTIALTNTMLVFDRILRDLILDTFPRRNLTTRDTHVEPVATGERLHRFVWQTPHGTAEGLGVDALGPQHYGVRIGNLLERGVYRLTALANGSAASTGAEKIWEVPFAVNGPADESRLDRPQRPESERLAWSATGAVTQEVVVRRDFWRPWMWMVLGCLLVEMVVLGWPAIREGHA